MTDQERHRDRLPATLPTPVRDWIDRRGVSVDRFTASSMACTPSRGCYWTGMYSPQQGMYGTFIVGLQFTMDPAIPTIGDLFKAQGYTTAFFGKWHLSPPGEPPTNAEALVDAAELNPLKGYGFEHSAIGPPSDVGGYNDGYTNDPFWTGQAVSWLRKHAKDDKPWICILSLLNPHDIQFFPRGFAVDTVRPDYDVALPPSFFAEPTLDDKPSGQKFFRQVVQTISGTGGTQDNPTYFRNLLNTYCDLIVGTDEMLGAAVQQVVDAGVLDDTVIVRTSDHGELGGSHRLQNKGTTMYDEQNRVPFTVAYPRRFPAGKRSAALGEAIDLVPTLLDIAGEHDPVGRWPWLRGVSLVPALESPDSPGPRDHTIYRTDEVAVTQGAGLAKPQRQHIRALYDGRYKVARYVEVEDAYFAGREVVAGQELEVYDTFEDPYEIRNLANDAGYAAITSELLAWLGEREKALFGPVKLREFGPRAPLTALPHVPNLGLIEALPSPFVTGRPGSYLVVPVVDPHVLNTLYKGRVPELLPIGGGGAAVDRARFVCALGVLG
jgi:arylsulfatase